MCVQSAAASSAVPGAMPTWRFGVISEVGWVHGDMVDRRCCVSLSWSADLRECMADVWIVQRVWPGHIEVRRSETTCQGLES